MKGGKNISSKIKELNLYIVDDKYIKYISQFDNHIAYNKNMRRPYIGIVFEIRNIIYFAPLSSPKARHIKMKNNIDFIKINGGRDGVINLNNMIPIPEEEIIGINIKEEIKKDKKYGLILKYQIKWCNKNKEQIIKNAMKLYVLISTDKANQNLKERCCNFKFLEEKLNQFILNQEKSE